MLGFEFEFIDDDDAIEVLFECVVGTVCEDDEGVFIDDDGLDENIWLLNLFDFTRVALLESTEDPSSHLSIGEFKTFQTLMIPLFPADAMNFPSKLNFVIHMALSANAFRFDDEEVGVKGGDCNPFIWFVNALILFSSSNAFNS